MPRKKALVATGNSMLTIVHALLSDPAAVYTDLGADYYEQRLHARRQARNHVKSLERLGCKVTIEAIDPATGETRADAAAPGRRPGPHRVQEYVASGPVAGVAAPRNHRGRMPAVP
jgi:hypothetical protein